MARVVGPLLVTEIYQELGTYAMTGLVIGVLVRTLPTSGTLTNPVQALAMLLTMLSFKTLVPPIEGEKTKGHKGDKS